MSPFKPAGKKILPTTIRRRHELTPRVIRVGVRCVQGRGVRRLNNRQRQIIEDGAIRYTNKTHLIYCADRGQLFIVKALTKNNVTGRIRDSYRYLRT